MMTAEAIDSSTGANPRIGKLIDYWRSVAPEPGTLPGRQHLNPQEIRELLPHIWLLDVVPGPPRRFRYRLISSGLTEAGLLARKGDFVDKEGLSVNPEAVVALFNEVVETRRPNWARGKPLLNHSRSISDLERVLLPLASDGRNVDMILCMTLFYWADGRVY